MKKIEFLMLHCTATPEGRNVTKDDILLWHTGPKSQGHRGWKHPGYADMISLNGLIINVHPYNSDNFIDKWEITNGAKGRNSITKHVVYVGGMDKAYKKPKDTRTTEQLYALEIYVKNEILRNPDIKVCGHNQFDSKACPSFDTISWLRSIGIPEKNIHK